MKYDRSWYVNTLRQEKGEGGGANLGGRKYGKMECDVRDLVPEMRWDQMS
jgi:hypothetical protein